MSAPRSTRPIPILSLYSGAGGLDRGLESTGYFATKVFVERDEAAIDTLEANFKGTVLGDDIAKLSVPAILRSADLARGDNFLLAAGPPCQLWSHARFWLEDTRKVATDPEATTLDHFLRVLKGSRPRAFVFENVWGLRYKTHAQVLDNLQANIERQGYRTWLKVMNAAEYGVPQLRKRLIMVGARDVPKDFRFTFPTPTHGIEQRPYRTAGDAIGDLANRNDLAEDDEQVNGLWGHLLPKVPRGENYLYFTAKRGHQKPLFKWRTKYWSFLLKLDPRLPSWTIAASPGPYTGPFHWKNRRLRLPELKRLQTFPMSYELGGKRRDQRRQVGNAVPPLLAEVIGKAIAKQIFT